MGSQWSKAGQQQHAKAKAKQRQLAAQRRERNRKALTQGWGAAGVNGQASGCLLAVAAVPILVITGTVKTLMRGRNHATYRR